MVFIRSHIAAPCGAFSTSGTSLPGLESTQRASLPPLTLAQPSLVTRQPFNAHFLHIQEPSPRAASYCGALAVGCGHSWCFKHHLNRAPLLAAEQRTRALHHAFR